MLRALSLSDSVLYGEDLLQVIIEPIGPKLEAVLPIHEVNVVSPSGSGPDRSAIIGRPTDCRPIRPLDKYRHRSRFKVKTKGIGPAFRHQQSISAVSSAYVARSTIASELNLSNKCPSGRRIVHFDGERPNRPYDRYAVQKSQLWDVDRSTRIALPESWRLRKGKGETVAGDKEPRRYKLVICIGARSGSSIRHGTHPFLDRPARALHRLREFRLDMCSCLTRLERLDRSSS